MSSERMQIIKKVAAHLGVQRVDDNMYGMVNTDRRHPDYGSDEPDVIPMYESDFIEGLADFVLAQLRVAKTEAEEQLAKAILRRWDKPHAKAFVEQRAGFATPKEERSKQ